MLEDALKTTFSDLPENSTTCTVLLKAYSQASGIMRCLLWHEIDSVRILNIYSHILVSSKDAFFSFKTITPNKGLIGWDYGISIDVS